jgi:hypothetical protein
MLLPERGHLPQHAPLRVGRRGPRSRACGVVRVYRTASALPYSYGWPWPWNKKAACGCRRWRGRGAPLGGDGTMVHARMGGYATFPRKYHLSTQCCQACATPTWTATTTAASRQPRCSPSSKLAGVWRRRLPAPSQLPASRQPPAANHQPPDASRAARSPQSWQECRDVSSQLPAPSQPAANHQPPDASRAARSPQS